MTQTVIASIIGAAAMIIVQLIVSFKQQRAQDIKTEYVLKEVQHDIKRLEDKQDKHNSLIERMTIVERDLKSAWRKLDEMKEER